MAISNRYENQTEDAIHERILDEITDDLDKRQGSVSWDMTRPTALEIAQAYTQLDLVLTFGFLGEDTPSNLIDLRVAEQGLYRRPSVKSTGNALFVGVEGLLIPSGTRLATDDTTPIYFITTESRSVKDGSVQINVEAEQGGISGNVGVGRITTVLGNLAGVVSVVNTEALEGGTNTESDASLTARYVEKLRNPITSGNVHHYKLWATEVPGVGDAKVFPIWNGPGTVKVVIVDSLMRPATGDLVTNTSEYIEDKRPVGARVTVVSAKGKAVTIDAKITVANGVMLQNVRETFVTTIEKYLQSITFKQNYISTARIGALLLETEGVLDYSNLTVNGIGGNINLETDEVPYLTATNLIM